MESFLHEAAANVFKSYALGDIKDVCIVLPSRRASFFFKSELSKLSDIPFISPTVFAIDDFVCKLSGLQISDQVSLIFDLYACYKKLNVEIKFEDFISWAPTVLKDFDLIDQYLVPDITALFNYMSEAEAMKRWEPDSSKAIEISEHTTSYFRLYDDLNSLYFAFRDLLENEKKAYRGMAYRLFAEDLENIDLGDLGYSHFHFIGLNALSKAEEQIVSILVKAGRAHCLWDTDEWFMNTRHQAGDVLRRYQKSELFGKWNPPKNFLRTDTKEVNIYESPFNSLQTKLGAEVLKGDNTVFVVPDENLIQPLLFSLGEEVEAYNITMGLGMGQSKLSSLVSTLFDLHGIGTSASNSGTKYNHTYVQKVLTDPFIKRYEGYKYPETLPFANQQEKIISLNKVFLKENELLGFVKENPLVSPLFNSWNASPKKAVAALKSIIEVLQESIFEDLDAMEREFFILFYGVLNRLEDEIAKNENLSIVAIKLLLKELSKLERVPFTGEPIAPLQIMSLLETRCLDFDHVVLFSFNEGVIPSSSKNSSLIPFEACKEYGIPVFSDQDSIMAYHFYRLLMRAKKVDLIYAIAKSKGIEGAADPSRFVLQLVNSLAKDNPNISLSLRPIDFMEETNPKSELPIEIEKTPELKQKLKTYLEVKGLSASSISQYYNCSLQFYFSKILGLKETDEVEETFGADVFGNWIHQSIEIISKEVLRLKNLIGPELKPKVLKSIPLVLDQVFEKHFEGYQVDRGINLIYRKMAEKLLIDYYEKCIFNGEEKLIISVEEKFTKEILVNTEAEVLKLKLNGLIDSIELHENKLVLIDFKTGKVSSSDVNVSGKYSFEESFSKATKGKFRQLALYNYLIIDQLNVLGHINGFNIPKGTELVSGMYSFRDLSEFHTQNDISEKDLVEEVENVMAKLLTEMMDEKMSFMQTTELKNCEYCAFKTVCNR